MYKIEDFAMLTPMRYYSNDDTTNQKRQDMIDNKNNEYIASCKKDGDWSMLIHYSKGNNLIRSRSISKVTGVYGDYTEKVPHICDAMDLLPDNTVLLAELCWDENGTNANTVGTILRCLPPKAVERQKEKKLKAVVFDLLMIDGIDYCNEPYINRVGLIEELFYADFKYQTFNFTYEGNPLFKHKYMYPTEFYQDSFAEAADQIIASGGEGVVIQRKDYTYNSGSRTAWKTLKLKQQLPEMELKVVGVLEPKMNYEGDCPDTWGYWYQDISYIDDEGVWHGPNSQMGNFPVTKPYFYGWKNGITVELSDGTTTDVASGLTDDDRAWLATRAAAQMIAAGELYAVVKAMSFNDKGRLRHPSLVRLRNDI